MMAQSMHESVQQRRAQPGDARDGPVRGAGDAARPPAISAIRSTRTSMAAVARTLPNHPLLNAELVDNNLVVFDAVNLGMAVAVSGWAGRDGDPRRRQEVARRTGARGQELLAGARAGKLKLADIEGGSFTVSNLGMFGVDGGFPLPRPPEGAILLVGRVRAQPALVDGALVERPMAWFSLTFDHRFIDGAAAAAFLQELQEQLSDYRCGKRN